MISILLVLAFAVIFALAVVGAFIFGTKVGTECSRNQHSSVVGLLDSQARQMIKSERDAARDRAINELLREPKEFWMECHHGMTQIGSMPIREGEQITYMLPRGISLADDAYIRVTMRSRAVVR